MCGNYTVVNDTKKGYVPRYIKINAKLNNFTRNINFKVESL